MSGSRNRRIIPEIGRMANTRAPAELERLGPFVATSTMLITAGTALTAEAQASHGFIGFFFPQRDSAILRAWALRSAADALSHRFRTRSAAAWSPPSLIEPHNSLQAALFSLDNAYASMGHSMSDAYESITHPETKEAHEPIQRTPRRLRIRGYLGRRPEPDQTESILSGRLPPIRRISRPCAATRANRGPCRRPKRPASGESACRP